MDKWKAVGQGLEALGIELCVECEGMSSNCKLDETFEQLYLNYVQLLETIKVQRRVIANRTNELWEETV